MSEKNRYKKYEPLFGAWFIKEKIGQGAVGQVYEIERKELGTTYKAALKAITIPEGPEDIKMALSSGVSREDLPDYYRNLIGNIANEFKYLAKLKGNSYIVNYEDHMIVEDKEAMQWDVLIKTELLKPLVEHVIDNPLKENDVLRLGIDICRALQFCGRYNILHRDIKPENIFIAPSGNYKLGDFGIARVAEETYVNLSRKGTYTYMAPEVFHGQAYDQSADLYSLGIVMYKYLNHGRIPFMPPYPEKIEYDDPEKAFTERMSGRQMSDPSGGSAKLRRIVLKACSYDPADRYETADEMLTELQEIYLSVNRKKLQSKGLSKNKSETARRHRKPKGKSEKLAAASGPIDEETKRHGAQKKKKNRNAGKRYKTAAAAVICLALAAGIYASIPKEVTDIKGVDPKIEIYYDGAMKPEYRIEPDWFKDEKIHFRSGNEDIFTVTEQGEIKAVSIGEADLTMTAKEYTETSHVSIVPKVTSIGGVEEAYSLYPGNEVRLEPKLQPDEFSSEAVTYRSSDEKIAAVSEDGTVTAAAVGEASIVIEAGGTEISTKVYVLEPVTVSASSTSKSTKKSTRKSSKKKSGGSSNGYFGDTEYF